MFALCRFLKATQNNCRSDSIVCHFDIVIRGRNERHNMANRSVTVSFPIVSPTASSILKNNCPCYPVCRISQRALFDSTKRCILATSNFVSRNVFLIIFHPPNRRMPFSYNSIFGYLSVISSVSCGGQPTTGPQSRGTRRCVCDILRCVPNGVDCTTVINCRRITRLNPAGLAADRRIYSVEPAAHTLRPDIVSVSY